MNHDLNESEVENILRGLAPAEVSPALHQRVAEELRLDMDWLEQSTTPRKPMRWLTPLAYTALGAAAAIAIMSYVSFSGTFQDSRSGVAGTGQILPVSTIREWDNVEDEGIHYTSDKVPEQHVKLRSTERHVFIDPRDGAQVIVEYPRVDSLVLPVNFQ